MPGMLDPYPYGRMRASMPRGDFMHGVVGPLEHKEFARDFVAQGNPLAAPALALAIPAYTGAKALAKASDRAIRSDPLPAPQLVLLHHLLKQAGMLRPRSPASLDEIIAGYEGMLGGLHDRFTK